MTAPQPTSYPELNAVLHELASRAASILGENFVGAYLQGSFAVGDYDEHSDVDFLVAIQPDLAESQLAALQALHAELFLLPSPWAQHLEGSYFPLELLRRPDPAGTPFWYLDNTATQLARSTHDNTVVVRWVTRERGIVLAGPPPEQLIDPIDADTLRSEIRQTMQIWGQSLLADPDRMSTRWYQSFAVASYCRMLQSLQTATIESKLSGVRWAQTALDPTWADLIQHAWDERPFPSLKSRQPADPAKLQRTRAFIQYALDLAGT